MIYVAVTLLLACGVLLFLMRRDNKSQGKSEEDNKILEAGNEALSHPVISDDDLVDSLRRKASTSTGIGKQ